MRYLLSFAILLLHSLLTVLTVQAQEPLPDEPRPPLLICKNWSGINLPPGEIPEGNRRLSQQDNQLRWEFHGLVTATCSLSWMTGRFDLVEVNFRDMGRLISLWVATGVELSDGQYLRTGAISYHQEAFTSTFRPGTRVRVYLEGPQVVEDHIDWSRCDTHFCQIGGQIDNSFRAGSTQLIAGSYPPQELSAVWFPVLAGCTGLSQIAGLSPATSSDPDALKGITTVKTIGLRAILHQHCSSLLLTAVVLTLVSALVLTRPNQPVMAENTTLQDWVPIASLTATSAPALLAAPTLTLLPTATPTLTPSITPIRTAPGIPTVTATPRPVYLVWAPEGQGGNLREAPNGRILELMRNGMWVEGLGPVENEAGLDWVYVLAHFYAAQPSGWMAQSLLHPVPDGDLLQVCAEEGVYLRAVPQGNIRVWLGDGSPLILLDTRGDWVNVSTLDGIEGWILSRLLIPYEIGR